MDIDEISFHNYKKENCIIIPTKCIFCCSRKICYTIIEFHQTNDYIDAYLMSRISRSDRKIFIGCCEKHQKMFELLYKIMESHKYFGMNVIQDIGKLGGWDIHKYMLSYDSYAYLKYIKTNTKIGENMISQMCNIFEIYVQTNPKYFMKEQEYIQKLRKLFSNMTINDKTKIFDLCGDLKKHAIFLQFSYDKSSIENVYHVTQLFMERIGSSRFIGEFIEIDK